MSITPWQTRWDTLGIPKDTAIQGEIDELRAALQERDAEIGLLNSTLESRDRNIATLADTSRAQRKVLTQAGDALSRFVYVECNQLSHHGKKEMHDFDKPCPVAAKVQAAITAIQEQLK